MGSFGAHYYKARKEKVWKHLKDCDKKGHINFLLQAFLYFCPLVQVFGYMVTIVL